MHAAGIYTHDGGAENTLFDYAISSYCSTPQDLLGSLRPVSETDSFAMVAIIEPEGIPGRAGPLPNTITELAHIRAHIPHKDKLIEHIGSQKTSSSTTKILDDLKQASIVHFGCHGQQSQHNPLESCLLLSDGALTISRIIREGNGKPGDTVRLAYLNACQTATGDEKRPDEGLTLAASMMFAGFKSVIGTMWSIHDADAPVVADVFYRYIFRNGTGSPAAAKDAAKGLHLAVAELRSRGRPLRNWVPFIHFGV
ncbi:hypothetical protein FA15DRAFT_604460 [Coprinopsis marcescibilis]|uniref:CHAT domain-containing protein n=1 Tax=Coprinopsis marcescibilis TaxID=230819 RepID=A0A5C3KCQ4_COPMA|nr:hypothetical protein FA15DRAFT_604460 [Coprinopsis marcescibilis]